MSDSAKHKPLGRPRELPPRIIRREIGAITRRGGPGAHGGDDAQDEHGETLEPELIPGGTAFLQVQSASTLARAGDPLAVLDQLRKYLEAERRRARSRMLMMGSVFVVVMAMVCVAGYFTIDHFRRQVSADLGRLGVEQAAAHREQSAARKEQEEARKALAAASSVIGTLASRTEVLRSEIDNANQTHGAAREAMDAQLARQLESLQAMRSLLSEVRTENSSLAAQYKDLNASWYSFTNDVSAALARAPSAALPVAPPESPAMFAELARPARDDSSISLLIVPAGHDRPIAWRMPLP